MPANYVLLEKVTLSATAASVVLNSIPQTGYTDLKIVVSARDTGDNQASIKFNSSTTGYSNIRLQGTGSAAQSTTDSSTSKGIIAYSVNQTSSRPANTFGNAEIYIPNYAGSTNKSFSSDGVEENNGTAAYSKFFAGLLANPAAIESITLSAEGVFEAGSTFYLYGLAAVGTTPEIAPFASGGDIVTNDGTYWYHAFLSSETFTPAKALSCELVVIGGGGGGGGDSGGGGGAGAILYWDSQELTSGTSNNVTIGAGGNSYSVARGNDSQFGTLTAALGGGGGRANAQTTSFMSGGSGGGAAGYGVATGGASTQSLGTATIKYGNAGGSSASSSYLSGAGGGGASAAGANTTGNTGGVGGDGTNAFSAWASATGTGVSGYYAGGGGGGNGSGFTGAAGGAGGGAQGGGPNGAANDGLARGPGRINTGSGGGGGSGNPSFPGLGGSGIVIVRYPMV